ncbi:MAG: FGGY-family carbohydrate kinase [Cyclobacteriaceae bacterium]
MKRVFLVFDIGTSDLKCGCINDREEVMVEHSCQFPMTQSGEHYEVDFRRFSEDAKALIAKCLVDKVMNNVEVEAMLITSQAQTFAPVDKDFNPLLPGIVWLDQRAVSEAGYLRDNLNDFSHSAGFQAPIPGLYASKLLWLKRNEPVVFDEASYFPLVSEYLAQQLTGQVYTDSTGFGMSGMYDYRHNGFNTSLLQILGLQKDHFPLVDRAATRGEQVMQGVQKEFGISYGFPVYLCGNDQAASAAGAGLTQPGEVNINFGTAMVLYTLTDQLVTDLKQEQISGKHPLGDSFFFLSYESDFGIQMRKLKEGFFPKGSYNQLFESYLQHPEVESVIPTSCKANDPENVLLHCAGVIKYYLKKLRQHLDQISLHIKFKKIYLSGGMTQSGVWLEILKQNLSCPIEVNNSANAGLVGAVNIYLNNTNHSYYAN